MEEISKDDIEDIDHEDETGETNKSIDDDDGNVCQEMNNENDDDAHIFNSSEPLKPTPYTPVFVYLKVGEASKNGSVVKYKVLSQKISETCKREVSRQYEDFEWMHHNLLTQCNIHGVIVPPLPPRPVIEAKTAELESKRHLGDESKTMQADNYDRDAINLEKYLKLLVVHSSFGSTPVLNVFLTEIEPATRSKVRKGFGDLMSWKLDYKVDLDPQFQQAFEQHMSLSACLVDSSADFNRMTAANQRLSVAFAHLASTITQTVPLYTDECPILVQNFKQWTEAFEDARHGSEVDAINDDRTLGSVLEQYARYLESSKDMLNRRLKLVSEYEESKKAVDKAKPQKKDSAEEARSIAEVTANLCTDVARKELKQFHRDRVLAMQDGLIRLADAKIKTARDTYTLLVRSLSAIKRNV